MSQFCHLHCHTQYSLLDGAAKIKSLISEVKNLEMDAIAITDHGNMFGIPHFVNEAHRNGVKPIVGCEFYLAEDRKDFKNKKRYHQILIAKNQIGYQNLSKLSSLSFIEGYYYKPRIDKDLIKKYSEGIIATSCCLASEICQTILHKGEKEAERKLSEWIDIFGDDYYIELQRHDIREQDICNEVLIKWAKKYNLKMIATNDVHYIKEEDSLAQDILLCLQTGKDYDDPNRMRFENNKFYLKSPQEMSELFTDVPQAIPNTLEIVDKIETPKLTRDILMPIFDIPKEFKNQDEYLRYLTYEKGKSVYPNINNDEKLKERINFELKVIQSMGFSGYFLIVQDLIAAAKLNEVIVGPGRGSVAGSAVAFCLGITDVDPIKYNLLFERFLNPERISMPDIDIDFDDEGRKKVIDYVVQKYGQNQVAQIITFGSMAAKSAIRDVSRVIGVPLSRADYIAKLIPDKLGTTLTKAFDSVPELTQIRKDKKTEEGKMLSLAETLEHSVRHTGIHAAGIIIAPEDITNCIPVKTDKDSNLYVTQYDGSVIESCGMLKMDFLGLKTLSIIKDTLKLIDKNKNLKIDISKIPLDDKKTFELYQKGDTIGTFQFESEGMRSWLRKLKPTSVEDLIAMNALYRPGPMQFIPNFINRKHGKEKIEYPHKLLENILQNTYGIMVYQEQIMQTAQIVAGYSLGEADLLRRAMGKKKVDEMAKQEDIFKKGAKEKHDIPEKISGEIFAIMAKFAEYGFNRSHSAAYSLIAYQTGYLKANYTSEYMSSVLSHNQNDISKISHFMDECKHQGIKILGPDVNESFHNFDVNKKGDIRFGLSAIKGAGDAAVTNIIEERNINGNFKDIYNFIERVNLRKVNKKTLESLALSGAFDLFEIERNKFIYQNNSKLSFIETLIAYGNKCQANKNSQQQSLFADFYGKDNINSKPLPDEECEPFIQLEKLRYEKEYIGFYLSGHPLDQFKIEVNNLCNCNSTNYLDLKNSELKIAGIITSKKVKQTKRGAYFCLFTLEDFYGVYNLSLFGETYMKFQHLINIGELVFVNGSLKQRYMSEENWDIKIKNISLLNEIRDKMITEVNLKFELENISKEKVETIHKIVDQNSGKCPLSVSIISIDDKINILSKSKKYRINPDDKFFESLKSEEIDYDIVGK